MSFYYKCENIGGVSAKTHPLLRLMRSGLRRKVRRSYTMAMAGSIGNDWNEWHAHCRDVAASRSPASPQPVSHSLPTQNSTPAEPWRAQRDEARRLLRKCPDLSDREIARRTGLAPMTVYRWRHGLSKSQLFILTYPENVRATAEPSLP